MSALVRLVVENYNEFVEIRDPIVDSWLLMTSPIPVLGILIFYLYFVLKLGPKLMESRKAYELKGLMIAYNAYQVLFSLWLCSQALKVNRPLQLLGHTCKNPSQNKEFKAVLSNSAWWYFFSKVVELLDTVFFVLRKKQSQVTFLHVYHHGVTMVGSWVYLKFVPGEQGALIGFLNCLVHVVMYFYYMVAAMGPKYQKYLWWKKYLTWMQLTQFGLMLTYLASIILLDCKLPKSLTFFFVANVSIFMYLFSNFYRKAYKKKINIENTNGCTTLKAQ